MKLAGHLINQQIASVGEDVIAIAEEKFERRLNDEMAKVSEQISKVNERITEKTSKLKISLIR